MQKATGEITQGAVLYIILMLVVILVGIAVVTGGNLSLLFQQKRLGELFEPGKVKLDSGEFKADCSTLGASYLYDLSLDNAKFALTDPQKKEGDKVEFYLLLDIRDKMFVGKDKFGNPLTVTCEKKDRFDCGTHDIRFDPIVEKFGQKEQLHMTVWRKTPAMDDLVEKIKGEFGGTVTFAEVLDEAAASYLGSFVSETYLIDVCAQTVCSKCGGELLDTCYRAECEALNSRLGELGACWFSPGILDITGSCNVCPNACGKMKSKEECGECGARLGCEWKALVPPYIQEGCA